MKTLVGLALALTLVGASAASAQTLELNLDRDRSQERGSEGESSSQRQVDHSRSGDRIIVRRNRDDAIETGGINCRTTVVRRMNNDGDIVTKQIRKCN
jgi:Ni/Co efflux regulator RcnB